MGYYINPADQTQTKEAWLSSNGEYVGGTAPAFDAKLDHTPVCLVDNGPFTAAAICYSEQELKAFSNRSSDPRLKEWYLVPNDKLIDVCPEVASQISQ